MIDRLSVLEGDDCDAQHEGGVYEDGEQRFEDREGHLGFWHNVQVAAGEALPPTTCYVFSLRGAMRLRIFESWEQELS